MNYLKGLKAGVITFAICYAIASFSTLEYNLTVWDPMIRYGIGICTALLFVLSGYK